MSAELTDEERHHGVVELIVHQAMWTWLVEAIEQRGFGVSPPIASQNGSTFRFITIPSKKLIEAEQALGKESSDEQQGETV